jgi:hypothetical protein
MATNRCRVLRVAGRALVALATWVLAGVGWGLLAGGALEAVFGQGADGLGEALGETSLVATFGAVVGVFGFGALLTAAPALGGALGGLLGGLLQPRASRPASAGLLHQTGPRAGAIGGAIGGAITGPVVGALCGVGITLDHIHGKDWDFGFVYWLTILAAGAGAFCGAIEVLGIIYGALPERLRHELRVLIPLRPPALWRCRSSR